MKKPSMISFIITLLLAAAVCTHCKEPVKDTAGNPIQVKEKYFIQPVSNGGGLVPAPVTFNPFELCPLGIAQTVLQYQPGLPVTFASQDNIKTIETSSTINIEFTSNVDWPVCKEYSKLWAVYDSSLASKKNAIIIGGTPGSEKSLFTIEKAGEEAGANTYKLITSTGTVGATPGDWFQAPQLYVLTKDDDAAKTLLVKFRKVDGATTATTATSRIEKLGLKMFPFY